MSHNPVDNQTKLSPNGTLHYYVGPAPYTKQGILLYNPKTKLVSSRRSFQQLNRHDPTIPELPLQVLEDDSALSLKFPLPHPVKIFINYQHHKFKTMKFKIWQCFPRTLSYKMIT